MSSPLITLKTSDPVNHVVGFSGSPRKNGNSDLLLKQIMAGVTQENMPADRYNLTDIRFQGCIGCERCRQTKVCTGVIDGMTSIYPKLYASKGLVLVSPTHNYNVTSWMKAFIDRLYCFYHFENDRPRSWSSQLANQDRKAIVGAICEQESAEDMGFTLAAMKHPLKALGYDIVGELTVFKIFDKGKVKQDEKAMVDARQLGIKLAASMISE
jgi:multimeric flavodoxin WrbA